MDINKKFIDYFAKATEKGAYGASLFVGKKDKIAADKSAVDQMRKELNTIDMKGKVVIGEGELDEAPMLYIGEELGTKKGEEFDIAVDPLEGTNFTANNLPNSLSVLAISRKGNLLNAPDIYMEKIAIGENLPDDVIDLDFDLIKNIERLADAKNTTPSSLSACVLKRPRHNKIVEKLNALSVKINFIDDGDVLGALSVGNKKIYNDIYLGIGGAPEGVLVAAALKCLNCQMQTRLVYQDQEQRERSKKFGINDFEKKYTINDMVKDDVIFCATGVTDGDLLKGIKLENNYFLSETLVLHKSSKTNKVLKNRNKI